MPPISRVATREGNGAVMTAFKETPMTVLRNRKGGGSIQVCGYGP